MLLLQLTNNVTDQKLEFNTHTIFLRESYEKIEQWIRENLSTFNLSEEYSCEVTRENNVIELRGDEDRLTFTITQISLTAISL